MGRAAGGAAMGGGGDEDGNGGGRGGRGSGGGMSETESWINAIIKCQTMHIMGVGGSIGTATHSS